MAKNLKEAPGGSRKDSGQREVRSHSTKAAKGAAATVLTQRSSKASGISKRVIKETSSTHRDALQRLADR